MRLHDYLRRAYRLGVPWLFGRSQFKLFLGSTFETFDHTILEQAAAMDRFPGQVQPIRILPPLGRSMLVIAPHQDDEIIGGGGALVQHVRSGRPAHVVIMHDGGGEHAEDGLSRKDVVTRRNSESIAVTTALGISEPRFLGYPDLSANMDAAIEDIVKELLRCKPDVVLVPFVLDRHPDHRLSNYILSEALGRLDWRARILSYEVWGLTIPNVILVVDDVIEEKQRLLSLYTYANAACNYVHSAIGLNMFHSRKLPAGTCRYAECFFEAPADAYRQMVSAVRRSADTLPTIGQRSTQTGV